MNKLKEYNLVNTIYDVVDKKIPFLGICLGLQLLYEKSEESPDAIGLSILRGKIKKIPSQSGIKIPHMGWDNCNLKNNGRLAMVHRMERLMEILFLMKKYNIEPKKIRFVYPNNAKNSDLVLIEGTLNGKSGLKIMNPLFVYVKKDVYSKEVKDMFGE